MASIFTRQKRSSSPIANSIYLPSLCMVQEGERVCVHCHTVSDMYWSHAVGLSLWPPSLLYSLDENLLCSMFEGGARNMGGESEGVEILPQGRISLSDPLTTRIPTKPRKKISGGVFFSPQNPSTYYFFNNRKEARDRIESSFEFSW